MSAFDLANESRAPCVNAALYTGNTASFESQAVAWITMLTSLLMDVRTWPVVWRRRLADYWRFGEKEHLAFLAVLLLMILSVLGVVSFAYLWGTRL